jgi:hypothetical protein
MVILRDILIDMGWGVLIFTLILLSVLFATGHESKFIYTDF